MLNWQEGLVLFFSFIVCNAVGVLLSQLFWKKVHVLLVRLSGGFGAILKRALPGVPTLWGLLFGSYSAMRIIDLPVEWMKLLDIWLVIAGVFSLTMVVARSLSAIAIQYAQTTDGLLPTASILANVIEALTYVTGILIILQTLGVSIAPILTALGVGGLAVALALQDTLANVFSGLHILVSKPIQAGNYIKLESGEEGYVLDISWRNTTIQALGNSLIIVPNQKIASAILINYDKPDQQVGVSLCVGVSYASDLDQVESITVAVAKEIMTEFAAEIKDFEPIIRFHTFGDSSILFNVTLRVQNFIDQYRVKHELVKRLHKRYAQEGIEIPFPIRTVQIKAMNE